MSESVSYSLYLSTFSSAPFLTANADLANVKYNINWDSFFNRDNYRYRSCRIRHQFLSDPCSSATYSYNPSTFNGVIVANGLTTTNGSPYGGTVLGLMTTQCVPYLANSVAVNNSTVLFSDYLNYPGQNIQMPQGYRELNIQLWGNNYAANGSGTLLSTVANIPLNNWNLNIVFELYDPIDEM